MASCDREPLPACGAIQNAGFLLYCARHDLRVVAFSQNFPESDLHGRSLSSLLQLNCGPDISPDHIAALEKLGAAPITWLIKDMPSQGMATFTGSDEFLLVEIEQIINNLITNALKFTPENGEIRVRLAGQWVLLAEDNADNTRALHFLLQKLGARCVSCVNGLAAYGELMGREFDRIISDVGMPKMNGYELIRNWRSYERMESLTPIPAIALTALASEADRDKALEAGFPSHLAKPINRSALIATLQRLGFDRP